MGQSYKHETTEGGSIMPLGFLWHVPQENFYNGLE